MLVTVPLGLVGIALVLTLIGGPLGFAVVVLAELPFVTAIGWMVDAEMRAVVLDPGPGPSVL